VNKDQESISSPGNPITLRVSLLNQAGVLAKLIQTIADNGGSIGAIDIVKPGKEQIIRDITINNIEEAGEQQLISALENVDGVKVIHWSDRVFLLHLGGKIHVRSKVPLKTREQLSIAYTPGVARVCTAIHEQPEKVHKLTIKSNTVAIVD